MPEIIALMCEASKIQHSPTICAVAGMFVLFSQVSWQQKHSKMNDKVTECITFLKYFSAAGKYHHTWLRCGQDALSVHHRDSCSRLRYQSNSQKRLSLQQLLNLLLFSNSVILLFQSHSWLQHLRGLNYFLRVEILLLCRQSRGAEYCLIEETF